MTAYEITRFISDRSRLGGLQDRKPAHLRNDTVGAEARVAVAVLASAELPDISHCSVIANVGNE